MMDFDADKVYKKVQKCFDSIIGRSGHLVSYIIKYNTFNITQTEKLENNNIKYYFSANVLFEFKFTIYNEDIELEVHPVNGSIILDKDFNYVRNEQGIIYLEPYRCLDPEQFKNIDKKLNNKNKKQSYKKDKTKTSGSVLNQEEINDLLEFDNE